MRVKTYKNDAIEYPAGEKICIGPSGRNILHFTIIMRGAKV